MITDYRIQAEAAEKVVEDLLEMHGRRSDYEGEFITDRYAIAAAVAGVLRDMNLKRDKP